MSSVQSAVDGASRLVPMCHADDCGLSAGITDAIVACYDRGWLRRTSVVVNGAGWEHAVAALRRRPGLAVALHLNLFEGRPLSPPAERGPARRPSRAIPSGVRRAVGARTCGRAAPRACALNFGWSCDGRSSGSCEAFADRGPLSVDGHVHYHVLPLVFDELLALCAEYPIEAIRLPREPLYWPLTPGAPRPAMVNVVKNVVLRALCRRAGPALEARSLKTTEAFVGVLGTGAMTLAHVRAALDHLRRAGTSGTVEILFHPGRARPGRGVALERSPRAAGVLSVSPTATGRRSSSAAPRSASCCALTARSRTMPRHRRRRREVAR